MGSIHNMFGSLNTGEAGVALLHVACRCVLAAASGWALASATIAAAVAVAATAATAAAHQQSLPFLFPLLAPHLSACTVVVREAGGPAGAALSVEPAVVQGCAPAPAGEAPQLHPMTGEQSCT